MANVLYPNMLIEKKYKSILETLINASQFCSLKPMDKGAGDTMRIVMRSVSGSVEELAMGSGNSGEVETTSSYQDYVLKTTQAKGHLYDEEAQRDDQALDTLLKGMGEKMVNSMNAKVFEEYAKAAANQIAGSITYDNICDAVALFNEQSEQKFIICNPSGVAALRKDLKGLLSYVEGFVRTGYVGTVNGMPIYSSAKCPAGELIIADATAVNLFLAKNQESEQKRDADTRKTEYFLRTVALAALVDATHVARIAAAQSTATTITTKTGTTVAGAGKGRAYIYINGGFVAAVDCASNAYSATVPAMTAGDEIKVVCHEDGHVASAATAAAV